jgi:hypothetical protein
MFAIDFSIKIISFSVYGESGLGLCRDLQKGGDSPFLGATAFFK